MFLKYESTNKEYFAINPDNVCGIRDFGNDITEIILNNSNTKLYARKSYIEVLGEMNAVQK